MKHFKRLMYAVIAASVTLLSACQHSESENTTASQSGELLISLTDAPGDFANYTVTVNSLTLTKANGSVIKTLPRSTLVDFSQYVDMTEFLTAAQIPAGIYTKATLSLDYTTADIWVENETGENVLVREIVDEDNQAITLLDVNVHLEDRNRLILAPGIPAHLSLDFDLKVSNSVSFEDPDNPVLTVQPIVVADVNVDLDKSQRVRGLLRDVNTDNNSFEIIVRPFFQPLSNDERFGKMKVFTSSTTSYEIDGVQYTGEDGITTLAGMQELSAVSVLGRFNVANRRFVAHEVYAGSSVPGGDRDAVRGTITSRTDNLLTVKGATLVRTDGTIIFNDQIRVIVDESTVVNKQGSSDQATISDISVGQKVRIFGTLTNSTATELEMDASNGHVRLLYSTLRGIAVSASSTDAELVMDLNAINNRSITLYDFSGTGSDISNDAEPANYEIHTDLLDLSNIDANEFLKVIGHVAPFASAPSDFYATTIVDIDRIKSALASSWYPASATALNISETAITLNFEGSGRFHHISRNGQRFDLTQLETQTQVVAEGESGLFRIEQEGTRTLHTDFESFKDDLTTRMESGSLVRGISGRGYYDDASNTFSAERITTLLQ